MLLPLAVRPKLGSVAAVPVSKQTFVVQAGEEKPLLQDGWFDSGDVAVLEEDNIVRLTDRAKDVIKSGGEWISSIDMENLAMGCPGVAEAAVVGIPIRNGKNGRCSLSCHWPVRP